jgi:hypothetical protein
MNSLKPMAALRGLFDVRFNNLVTPYIVGLLFVLSIVLAGLSYLLQTIGAFSDNAGFGVLYMFILGPLVVLLTIMSYRVWFELVVLFFRIWSIRHERMELLRIVARDG